MTEANSPVRAWLFDYGGTLDGEGWHWFDRFVHLYREAGCEVSVEDLRRAFYTADAELSREAATRAWRLRPMMERHVEVQASVLGEPVRRVAERLVDGFCAITEGGWANARDALARLGGGARLGVVSNFYGNLEAQLEEAGLAPLLDVVVESVAVGVEKPDPAIYRIALERVALPAASVAMVGDNFDRDCRPAKAVGMRAVWLRRGDRPAPETGVADRVIGRLAELVDP